MATVPSGRPSYDYPFAAIPVDLLTDKDVSATAVRVFAILARIAYEAGNDELQVTHEEIASRINCSPRSIARPLAQLESLGWIERRICNTALGRSADFYHLNAQRADERTGVGAQRADSRTRDHADLRGPTTLKKEENTPSSSSDSRASNGKAPAAQTEQDFEDWYRGYPRKVSKGAARKAYRAARQKVDADTLLVARDAYARLMDAQRVEPRYIKHPSAWLNQECWDDEVPEHDPFKGPEMRYG